MADHKSLVSFKIVLAIAVGLALIAALAIGLTIWWLRAQAIESASQDASNLATVLADQTHRSVQLIDSLIAETQERIRFDQATPSSFNAMLKGKDTFSLLTNLKSRLSEVASITLVDDTGVIVNSSSQWPMPALDISEREHFRYLKAHNTDSVYISPLTLERISNSETLFFAKRINSADGEFLGIISVGMRLSYFQHIYKSITSLVDMSFLFLRKDGTVIVRYPGNSRAGEKLPENSPWYSLVAKGGIYWSPGYFDTDARLVAVRPLKDFPLVVNVALSEAAALSAWRRQAVTIGVGTFLILCCLAFLLRSLNSQFHSLSVSQKRLQEKADELERVNAKADAALNNMSQGLAMFDQSAGLIVCNDHYIRMYMLPMELAQPGRPLADILKHRAGNGTFLAEGNGSAAVERYLSARTQEVQENRPYQEINKLTDGRYISVVHRPLSGGGWVATHEDVTESTLREQHIRHMAHYDALTNLPNRANFNEVMRSTLDRAKMDRIPFAILSADLDHFKEANDTHGHLIGDALLREAGSRLQIAAQGAFVSRIGGDEFVVISKDAEAGDSITVLAERLLAAFAPPFEIDGHSLKLGMSIGIGKFPDDGEDAKTLLNNADAALYRAKADARGIALTYAPEMGARVRERHTLQEDLRRAITSGDIFLNYQPQLTVAGETIAFEALVRWQCPVRGLVCPATFIPVAEESRLIVPIGEWVLREACREAATWPNPLGIAVNISPVQFRHGDLPRLIHSILLETGLSPGRLELEITESVMIDDFSRAVSILNRLRSLGVKIAMDDFGTGYSSLSYLQAFRCDKIKIDRVFICDLESNKHSRAIVRAVIGLGKSLELPILAEGVETQDQLEFLIQEGCDEVQGYLKGRPLPIDAYASVLGRDRAISRGLTRKSPN